MLTLGRPDKVDILLLMRFLDYYHWQPHRLEQPQPE